MLPRATARGRVGLQQGRSALPTLMVFDEASQFRVVDPRDAVLARCQADPVYQRWVLACLQVRLSIQADQTFRHPPDRRAEVARIMAAAYQRRAPKDSGLV